MSAAKHAVEGITKSVALETAKSGIRVNGVAPGPTDTGMLDPFYRHVGEQGGPGGECSDGSARPHGGGRRRIVFIASDEARFITGHILTVDGGHSAN